MIAGTVAMVKSSGEQSISSGQVSGIETVAWAFARRTAPKGSSTTRVQPFEQGFLFVAEFHRVTRMER